MIEMNTRVTKHVSNWLWFDVFMQSSEYSKAQNTSKLVLGMQILSDSQYQYTPNHNEFVSCFVTVFTSNRMRQ